MPSTSENQREPASDRELLRSLGAVASAFYGRFDSFLPSQREAIEPILSGKNTLVSAATASGKTEAVLAPLIARLLRSGNGKQVTRILVVTPTRALVNDLRRRISDPIAAVGWTCGAQTSDHRQREARPHVLITTPESFDSTLIAGFVGNIPGSPTDHLLAAVEAVFFDEAHFYYGSPRGDQLLFLTERLRRLRSWARERGIVQDANLQLCGASATAGNPTVVANWLLGSGATVVQAQGSRTIEVLSKTGEWFSCGAETGPAEIAKRLPLPGLTEDLAELILRQRSEHDLQKWLFFAPSRSMCDELALALSETVPNRADFWIGAHHSSLTAGQREDAETNFEGRRTAILVATSTLEVGVDIGDVDVVCQIGCPPSASSLLQRIGRGSRRQRDKTRLIALPRGHVEACAFSGIIHAAARGEICTLNPRRYWSVLVQQSLAYMKQNRGGRSMDSLVDLASAAWPQPDTPGRARRILGGMLEAGTFEQVKGLLRPSEDLSEKYGEGGALFANFDTVSSGLNVVDYSTGQMIANVSGIDPSATSLVIGGRRLKIVTSGSGGVEVQSDRGGGDSGAMTARYASKRMPVSFEYAQAVRSMIGLPEGAAPILENGNEKIWFHFGGEIWGRLWKELAPPQYSGLTHVRGLAVSFSGTADQLKASLPSEEKMAVAIRNSWSSIAAIIEKGRFFPELPAADGVDAIVDLVDGHRWCKWCAGREIAVVARNSPLFNSLNSLLL